MTRAKKIIPIAVLLLSVASLAFYFFHAQEEAGQIAKEVKEGKGLLDLYEKNNDLVGWIRVPGTVIDYPVMDSDAYLHADFNKEYKYRGTPFVQDGWKPENANAMIFGHNMWAERTMFNPLHKYEEKKFWKENQTAEFFVIRDRESPSRYVEKRTYQITDVCMISIKSDLYFAAESTSRALDVSLSDVKKAAGENFDEAFAETEDPLQEFYQLAEKEHLYDTNTSRTADAITLSTCSYHIKGNRSAGRIFVIGSRIKTENKDIGGKAFRKGK